MLNNRLDTDYATLREWCITIGEFLLKVDQQFDSLVNGDYGIKSIIKKADESNNKKKVRALYKELNIMVREMMLPASTMNVLNKLLDEKFGYNFVGETEKDKNKIQKIIQRGKIRNDKEFELVKRREEEIYADDSQQNFADTLRTLMTAYLSNHC